MQPQWLVLTLFPRNCLHRRKLTEVGNLLALAHMMDSAALVAGMQQLAAALHESPFLNCVWQACSTRTQHVAF